MVQASKWLFASLLNRNRKRQQKHGGDPPMLQYHSLGEQRAQLRAVASN
jgi:hypothetical protein